jgi:hypothetical protein
MYLPKLTIGKMYRITESNQVGWVGVVFIVRGINGGLIRTSLVQGASNAAPNWARWNAGHPLTIGAEEAQKETYIQLSEEEELIYKMGV